MKTLDFPQIGLEDFYMNFVSRMQEESKEQYLPAYDFLLEKEKEYECAGNNGTLDHMIEGLFCQENQNIINLTQKDFVNLYVKFQKSSTTSKIRKGIKDSSKSKCVYCEKRSSADTLDHILPKSSFPYYTILPMNLVSSCVECNSKKNALHDNVFNPYFIDINNKSYIICDIKILTNTSRGVSKSVIIPRYMFNSQVIKDRDYDIFKTTCEKLSLLERYSDYCVEYIDEKIMFWQNILEERGKMLLINILESEIRSLKNQYSQNSFIIPFYLKLLSFITSPTFCETEFLKVSH